MSLPYIQPIPYPPMYDNYTNGSARMHPKPTPITTTTPPTASLQWIPTKVKTTIPTPTPVTTSYIDLDKVVTQMKRYSCTCLSRQGSCKTHDDTEQIKPTQKLVVPLHKSNARKTASKQGKQVKQEENVSENEKQKKREMERENFRMWLIDKAKQKEEKIKLEKQQQLRKLREVEEKKKMRKEEGELRYKLWLKEKERQNLENKIREQLETLTTAEEKQSRLQKSEEAYKQWLLKSSYRSNKPASRNKGLESLKSSACCVFNNPEPWVTDEKNDSNN